MKSYITQIFIQFEILLSHISEELYYTHHNSFYSTFLMLNSCELWIEHLTCSVSPCFHLEFPVLLAKGL